MVNRFYKFWLLLILFVSLIGLSFEKANGQCLPRSNFYYGEILPGCNSFTSVNDFGPGQYFRMPVTAGVSYTISTCGSSFDTQLTGFQGNTTSTSIFYNDDNGPDCGGLQASVTFTPTFTDYTRVNVNQFNCQPGGSTSAIVRVRENLLAAPTITSSGSLTPCPSGPAPTLSVQSPNPAYEYYWQTSAGGTSLANAGTTFSPTSSGTYYVRPRSPVNGFGGGGCWSPTSNAITITYQTISSPPTMATVTPDSVCSGASTVNLQASGGTPGSGADIEWYLGSPGGTPAGTGANINVTPPPVAGSYTYWARYEGNCNTTTAVSSSLAVQPDPSILVSGPASVCLNGTATLNAAASDGTGTYSYQWESAPSATGPWTSVGVNSSSYTTGPLTSTSFFRCILSRSGAGCNNATSNVVSVAIQAQPTISIVAASTSVCVGDSTNLNASTANGSPGCTIQWQSASSGAGPWANVGTNNPLLNTGAISANTFYRAIYSCPLGGCQPDTSNTVAVNTDNIPPTIACPANISTSTDPSLCSAIVTYVAPVGTDNCPGASTSQIAGLPSGSAFPLGTTTNSFRVFDAAGNADTCSFDVVVADNEDPVISCPGNISTPSDPGLCTAVVTFSAPTSSDNCPGASVSQINGLASGSAFPSGITTNTFRVVDAAGNADTCSFTVTVTDTTKPTIVCPGNISDAAGSSCTKVVTYPAPTVVDTCGVPIITQIAGLPTGSNFPIGITTNTFVATDPSGNADTCSFTVSISDTTPPVVNCSGNITVGTDPSICGANVIYSLPTASDNCGVSSLVQVSGLPSGSVFPTGTTQVAWAAADTSGNNDTCFFTVTVVDSTDPVLSCPVSVSLTPSPTSCDTVYNYSVTALDNCGTVTVNQIAGLASGSAFPIGVTTNTFVATDSTGNTDTCTFSISVSVGSSSSYTWVGTTDTSWHEASNWIPCGIPGPTDTATIASAPNNPVSTGHDSLGVLVVQASGQLTIRDSFTILQGLTNGGSINASTAGLLQVGGNIGNSGTLSFGGPLVLNGLGGQQLAGNFTGPNALIQLIIQNSDSVTLGNDVESNQLLLDGGLLVLNGNEFRLTGSAPGDLVRNSGFVVSEDEASKMVWEIGSNTGSYQFPFGTRNGLSFIPVNMNITSAGVGAGELGMCTYPTSDQNLPLPAGVANMHLRNNGLDLSDGAADRFWRIEPTGYSANPLSNVTFSYSDDDLLFGATPINEPGLSAYRWDGAAWDSPVEGTVDAAANTFTMDSISQFSPWVLAGPCVAGFSADTACLGQPTTFIDSSSGTLYSWDFDTADGVFNSSVAGSIQYTFPSPGSRTVRLIVGNVGGCVDTFDATVVVDSSAMADFSVSAACANDSVLFTDNSTMLSAGSTYDWDFDNDGTYDLTGQAPGNVNHLYGVAGNYVAKLRVNNPNGCSDSVLRNVNVSPTPSTPTATGDSICAGENATLLAVTGGANGDFYWYSDAGLSNLAFVGNPFNTSTPLSNTDYWVVERNSAGCSSDSVSVSVIVDPIASPTVINDTICPGSQASLVAATGGVNGDFEWYSDAALNNLLFVGNPYIIPAGNVNASISGYLVEVDGGCQSDTVRWDVVINNSLLAAPTTTDDTVCAGDVATLTATAGGTINWYSDAGLSNLIQTGSVLVTGPISSQSSFWAVQSDSSGCQGDTARATVFVDSIASPTVMSDTICVGGQATLMASTGGANGDFEWYSDAALSNLLFIGNPYTTGSLFSNTSGYVIEVDGGCQSDTVRWDVVINNSLLAAPTTTDDTVCAGDVATLTATAGGTINWYSDAGLSNLIQTGSVLVTGPISSQSSFWAVQSDSSGCQGDTARATVFVDSIASPTVMSDTICAGSQAILMASTGGANGDFEWYSDAALSNLLFIGNPYTTGSLFSNTSGYVVEVDGGCQSDTVRWDVVINNSLLAAPTTTNDTVCAGDVATLTATAGGRINWYSDAGLSNLIHTGSVLVTGPISSQSSYWAVQSDSSGCQGDTARATVFVDSIASPTVMSDTICAGGQATLMASTGGANGDFEWYSDAALSNLLFIGNPYTTGSLFSNTSGYVVEVDGGCQSDTVRWDVVINNSLLAAPTTTDDTVCAGDIATLTATAGGTINWYSDAGLSNLIQTGSVLVTGPISSQSSYWAVQSDSSGCQGDTARATVFVDSIASPTVSNDTTCTNSKGTLTAISGGANGDMYWYNDAGLTNLLYVGNPLIMSNISSTTTVWLVESDGNCQSDTVSATIVVNSGNVSLPVVGNDTVCAGEQAILASSTGSNLYWFNDPGFNSLAFIGNPFVTPPISSNTSFWVFDRDSLGCRSDSVRVDVILDSIPSPTVIGDTICPGGQAVVVGISGGANGTINWYSDPGLNNLLGVGNPLVINPGLIYADLTVYGVEIGGNCQSDTASATIHVQGNPLPTPVVTGDTICAGDAATLSVAGNGTFEWYNDPALSSLAFIGNSFASPPINVNTSFWVIQRDSTGCTSDTSRADVLVRTIANPTAINDTICPGASASVFAQSGGANGDFYWYSDAALNNLIAVGNPLNYPQGSVFSSTSGWLVERDGTCESDTVRFEVVVQPIAEPTVQNDSICPGANALLSATSGGSFGQMHWYSDSTLTNLSFIGNPFVSPSLFSSTSYWLVEVDSNGCRSNAVRAEIVVKANPAPSVQSDTICPGDQAVLSASSNLTVPGTFIWFSDTGLLNQVFTGNPYITPALQTTTSYWVVEQSGNCLSDSVRVRVVVDPLPLPSVSDDTICNGETAVLTASTGGSNGDFYWYSDPALTNLAFIGNPFLINNLGSDTTFWLVEDNGVCRSDSVSADVIVLPQPIADFDISKVCFGDSTNFIDNSSGIEAGATYLIDVNGDGVVDFSQGPGNFSYLAASAGTFDVTVVINNPSGCTDTFQSTYVVDSVPVPAFTTDTVCEGEPTTFTDQSSVISPGASYRWDFDNNSTTDAFTAGTVQFTYPASGQFTALLSITNVNGCSDSVTGIVLVSSKPTPATLVSNSPLCNGDTLVIDATAASGLSFSWSGPNGFTDTTEDITINDVTEADHQGFYELVLTDTLGCSSDPASEFVEISPIPQTPEADNTGPVCEGEDAQLLAGNVVDAIYVWNGPNGFSTTQQNPTIFSVAVTDSGLYTVYAEVNGCRSELGETRLIVYPGPNVQAFGDTSIEEGGQAFIDATGAIVYNWSPVEFMSTYDISNPVVSGLPVGTNDLIVTGYDERLCSATDTIVVTVTAAQAPNVYEIITPNGDGHNDFWVIEFPTGTVNYEITVYDRGGNEVFNNINNYNNDWGGTRDGKELPEGAYWYIIEVDGNVFSGGITIIR